MNPQAPTLDWIFQQLLAETPEPIVCRGPASRLRSLRTSLYKDALVRRRAAEPCPPFSISFAAADSPDQLLGYRQFARLPGSCEALMTIQTGSAPFAGISITSGTSNAPVSAGNADDFLDALGVTPNST